MKPLPKLDKREVLTEAADSKTWSCTSCSEMIEEGIDGPHCRRCGEYWKDVAAGLFDDHNYWRDDLQW